MSSKISFIVSALMTKYGLDEASAEKFAALLYIRNVNGYPISVVERP